MKGQEKYQAVRFETVMALDGLMKAFLHFTGGALSDRDRDRLLEAMRSNSDNFEDIGDVAKRVSSTMQDIYYNFTGDTTDLASVKRKVDELRSILHIGRSYPDDAIRRVKNIATAFRVDALRKKKR